MPQEWFNDRYQRDPGTGIRVLEWELQGEEDAESDAVPVKIPKVHSLTISRSHSLCPTFSHDFSLTLSLSLSLTLTLSLSHSLTLSLSTMVSGVVPDREPGEDIALTISRSLSHYLTLTLTLTLSNSHPLTLSLNPRPRSGPGSRSLEKISPALETSSSSLLSLKVLEGH